MVGMALKDIADAMGDVDAFIAQYDPKTRKVPKIAAEIAERLLATGRAEDALGFIERADIGKDSSLPREWQDTRLEVLEALDRKDEAQAFRWTCFESIRLDQASFFTQFRFALMRALASSISFRMSAVMATFGGFPALIMAWYLALRSGLCLIATRAGM